MGPAVSAAVTTWCSCGFRIHLLFEVSDFLGERGQKFSELRVLRQECRMRLGHGGDFIISMTGCLHEVISRFHNWDTLLVDLLFHEEAVVSRLLRCLLDAELLLGGNEVRLEVVPRLICNGFGFPFLAVFHVYAGFLYECEGIGENLRWGIRLAAVGGEFLGRFDLIDEDFKRR